MPRFSRDRRIVIAGAALVAVLVALVAARDTVFAFVAARIIAASTGYDVQFGSLQLGTSHGVARDVHVTKNGDPVLDADRVDVDYALRDIFPGGEHRFGFVSAAIDKAVITVVRHNDGFSFNRGGSAAAPPAPTKAAVAPYFFDVRVRRGTIRLVDVAPLAPDLAYQTVDDVSFEASVKSDTRTTARLDGVLVGARAQGAPVVRWPLHERTIIDRERGIAVHHVFAQALPLRGMLGFFLHQPVARFDDGVLTGIDVRAYAVDIPRQGNFDYRYGGTMTLAGARLNVGPLARPVRNLHGTLDVCDDAIVIPQVDGTIGALPLRARGGLYGLLSGARFRLGLAADGDLHDLRALFSFSEQQPVRGAAHIETALEADVAKPLIRNVLVAPLAAYDRFALRDLDVLADYYDGVVTVSDTQGSFGALSGVIGGSIDVSGPQAKLALAGTAHGPAAAIPYAQLVGGHSDVRVDALIGGTPEAGYTARGAVQLTGETAGSGFFAVDEKGRGEFGPFALARNDGSSLVGALRLERPISQSAGWIDARRFRVDEPSLAAALPGVPAPALPPISGTVDAQLAGGGTPDAFDIAGRVSAHDATVAGRRFGMVQMRLGGSLDNLTMRDIAVDGPYGRYRGDGDARDGVFATRGRFDGPIAPLAALAGRNDGRGAAHANLAMTVSANRMVLQTDDARLDGAEVLGVRGIDAAAGTIALEGERFESLHVYAGRAHIGGGDAVAAGGSARNFLVSAPAIAASDVRDTGIPLQSGTIAVFGVTGLNGGLPSFDGGVVVRDGAADGRHVSGAADVHLENGMADVRGATVALGATYGDLAGRIAGIGRTALAYDLDARVPFGDVGVLRRDLSLPPQLRTLAGSFDANLHVRGAGARPDMNGTLEVPEGSFNGLAFRDGHARIDVSSSTIGAHSGRLTVGSTTATLDASYASGAYAVRASSAKADLADFNDYFDDADVLAGRGSVAVALTSDPGRTATTGRVDLRDVRYRLFPLGATRASWSSVGNRVRGEARIDGPAGAMTAAGSIATAHGSALDAFRGAYYDLHVAADRLALGTWLPAAGFHVPVVGALDGTATVRGRYPQLALDSDLALHDGVVAGYRIASAAAQTRSAAGGRIAVQHAVADLGFATLSATGTFGLAPAAPVQVRAHATVADIGQALHRIAPQYRLDIGGALDLDARIAGTLVRPQFDAGFDLEGGRYASLPIPRVIGSVAFGAGHVTLREAEVTLERGSALVAGTLPLQLSPLAIGPPAAPVSFDVQARGVELAPFSRLVPVAKTRLGGTLDGRVGVEGTVRAPRVLGAVTLTGGSYVSSVETAPITGVTARLAFAGTSVALEAFHASVGGGSLDGGGRLDLPIPGAPKGGYSVALTARGDVLDFPQYGRGRVDGQLTLRSGVQRPVLSGAVTLSDATIPFAAIYRAGGSGAGGAAGGPALPFDLGFDLEATAARNVRVRAPFLDVGAAGAVALTGTLASPRLAGAFTTTPGGIFTTYNHVFRVQSGVVTFDPAAGIVPNVDLRATAHVVNPDPDASRNTIGSADITVVVTGPADGFSVAFSSEPPYSTDEIVALLSDIPALLGSVRFGRGLSAANLPGAPVPENPLDPPGVTAFTQNASLNFNEEAFSLLNAQLAQRFLGPLERIFGNIFGLTDFQITLDYGGGVGFNARQRLGHREVYANIGQTFSYPGRTQLGIDAEPNNSTSVIFGYYSQSGVTSLTDNGYATTTKQVADLRRLHGVQPLGSRSGVTITITRRFR